MLSRRPKKRGPFQRVPVMAKAIAERLSYRVPVPQEATVNHDGPLGDAVPFTGQDGAGLQLDLSPVEGDELGRDGFGCLLLDDTIKELANRRIEVARLICLSPIAYDGCL